jgi:hypothetical protein
VAPDLGHVSNFCGVNSRLLEPGKRLERFGIAATATLASCRAPNVGRVSNRSFLSTFELTTVNSELGSTLRRYHEQSAW